MTVPGGSGGVVGAASPYCRSTASEAVLAAYSGAVPVGLDFGIPLPLGERGEAHGQQATVTRPVGHGMSEEGAGETDGQTDRHSPIGVVVVGPPAAASGPGRGRRRRSHPDGVPSSPERGPPSLGAVAQARGADCPTARPEGSTTFRGRTYDRGRSCRRRQRERCSFRPGKTFVARLRYTSVCVNAGKFRRLTENQFNEASPAASVRRES